MNVEDACKEAFRNRDKLLAAKRAGCYQCIRAFFVTDITEWTDGGQTAICPHCDIDSVLANVTDASLLAKMNERWFCGDAPQPAGGESRQ